MKILVCYKFLEEIRCRDTGCRVGHQFREVPELTEAAITELVERMKTENWAEWLVLRSVTPLDG
jgi:hypothetical protein